MRIVYRFIWVPSAVAIVAMAGYFGSRPLVLPDLAEMKRFTTGDQAIRILHPGNWKPYERGMHGVESELAFEPARSASLKIDIDLQGSLVADIARSADSQLTNLAGMVPGGPAIVEHRLSPTETMHAAQAIQMGRKISDYPDFKDGETTKEQIAGREAVVTDCTWSAPGLLGSRPVVGRRITLLSGDHHVSVVYGCLKEMEPIVLPVFKLMVDSLELDVQGGSR